MSDLQESNYRHTVEGVSRQMLGGSFSDVRAALYRAMKDRGIEVDSDNLDAVADNISKGIEQPG